MLDNVECTVLLCEQSVRERGDDMPACMPFSSTEGMRLLPFFFALPEMQIDSFICEGTGFF
jgi:hypothetical protein